MNCSKCHHALDADAAFCGNCGQPVAQAAQPSSSPIEQVIQNQPAAAPPQPLNAPLAAAAGVPAYAVALPGQHSGDNKAVLALLFGIAGIVGALFIVLLGLVLGLAGLIMGTMSRSSSKRGLSTAGLVVSSVAILGSLGVWAYAVKHYPQTSQQASSGSNSLNAPAVSASRLSTPCYAAGFASKFNVSNSSGSCDMEAFNGSTAETSTDAYKVYAATSQTISGANFLATAKPALEKDIQTNLPTFAVTSEGETKFAGSPAYTISALNSAQKVAVVEMAVFHQVTDGENFFILVHAVNANSANLNGLEAQWQWK